MKFEFQLFNYLVVELPGEYLSSSEHIFAQHMGMLPYYPVVSTTIRKGATSFEASRW